MKIDHFDVDRIIGITMYGKRPTSHKWLPAKQKTTFFGLIKRNAWHSEGFYSNGCYEECYESGCWDATPSTAESLRDYGYLVEGDGVYYKPSVTVFLESKCQVSKTFETAEEARSWVDALKATSGKTFEIVEY